VLRSFNPARDHILVRRQPGGRLELPREVIGAEMASYLCRPRFVFKWLRPIRRCDNWDSDCGSLNKRGLTVSILVFNRAFERYRPFHGCCSDTATTPTYTL
jgi:hypothetical protein